MNVLRKKLKKVNQFKKWLFYLSVVGYLIALVIFIINLLSLNGIETFLRIIIIIVLIIWFLIYPLWNLINLILNKKKTYIFCLLITLIITGITLGATYYIHYGIETISDISEKEYITYTTNLIVLKGNQLTNSDEIGMIKDKKDIEGNILAQELIKKEKLTNKIKYYDDYYEMLSALYNGDIKAIFVSSNYAILFSAEEAFANIADDTEVLYEFSKEMPNEDINIASNKKLNEPFSILIMGVDSEKEGLNANAAFNGDTLMLITFNPNTLNATMFSIPRDTYVPIACRNNAYNKINSSAAYGTNCVLNTVQNLTDIKIDYYVKINFKGVVDLVNAVGGVEVEVGKDFCEQDSNRNHEKGHEICLKKGKQTLNGEQALAFSRHRKTLPRGDIDRAQNQQLVVEALAQKMLKLKNYNDFKKVLESITKNIATNMNKNSILSLYDVLKAMLNKSINDKEFITIQKTYLEYYSLPVYLKSSKMYTSAIGYYPDSLKDIINAMKINLELEKKEMIKTFSYSINEEYEGNIIGKNKRSGSTLELVPDFTGKSLSTATSWASRNGIKINSVTVNAGEQYFNSNFATGLITNQNVHVGVLAKEVSSITVYVNGTNNKNANNNKVEETDDNKETDKTESSEDNETKKPGNIDPDNPDLDDLLNIN